MTEFAPGPSIESSLIPLGELVDAMTGFQFALDQDLPEGLPRIGDIMRIEEFTLDLPIELEENETPEGEVQLGAAPPTQQIETGVMPVFHRLRLRMTHADIE